MEDTKKVKDLSEEELEKQDDVRFNELNKKSDRNEDEVKELGEIKTRHGSRVEKRINKLTYEKKTAVEEAAREKQEKEELKARVAELEQAPLETAAPIQESFIDILDRAGKVRKWHTDESLAAQVQAGKTTEIAALDYQRRRNHEHAVRDAVVQIKEERVLDDQRTQREKDARLVLEKHPEWANTHPNYNSEDPLFKLTTELYNESYAANANGMSLAEKRASQILRITDTPIDRTGDFNLKTTSPSERRTQEPKEVTLTPEEEEAAITMFTRGDAINPKTKRAYTVNEARAVALEAKKERGR